MALCRARGNDYDHDGINFTSDKANGLMQTGLLYPALSPAKVDGAPLVVIW